jgi:hypothetical protein
MHLLMRADGPASLGHRADGERCVTANHLSLPEPIRDAFMVVRVLGVTPSKAPSQLASRHSPVASLAPVGSSADGGFDLARGLDRRHNKRGNASEEHHFGPKVSRPTR